MEAAARISAQLMPQLQQKDAPREEIRPLTSANTASSASTATAGEKEDEEPIARVGINHLSAQKRLLMARKTTAEDCLEKFGVYVTCKGAYHAADAPPAEGTEPLYLELKGPSLTAVNACSVYLKELQAAPEESQHQTFTGKVYVGIPGNSPFNVVPKLVGPQGEFVKHIKRQANCSVQVAGKDCGLAGFDNEDELHVAIEAHSADGLAKAKQLVLDLVAFVKLQYNEWLEQRRAVAPPPPPSSASLATGRLMVPPPPPPPPPRAPTEDAGEADLKKRRTN